MKLEKEDYIDPACPLCGKPGETESPQPVPVDRIQRKLREYEDASDWAGAERHLKYWLAEAEMNRDQRGQLMLHNELMGYYRKQGNREAAFLHADAANALVSELQMEETVTAGTTWVNAGTYTQGATTNTNVDANSVLYFNTDENVIDLKPVDGQPVTKEYSEDINAKSFRIYNKVANARVFVKELKVVY